MTNYVVVALNGDTFAVLGFGEGNSPEQAARRVMDRLAGHFDADDPTVSVVAVPKRNWTFVKHGLVKVAPRVETRQFTEDEASQMWRTLIRQATVQTVPADPPVLPGAQT